MATATLSSEAEILDLPIDIEGDQEFDQYCDNIRNRLDNMDIKLGAVKTDGRASKANDLDANLINFPQQPDDQIANYQDEDVLSDESIELGMAELHHSNIELKALLESLTSAVSVSENATPERNERAEQLEEQLKERDSEIAKMKIAASLLQSENIKLFEDHDIEISKRDAEIKILQCHVDELDLSKSEFESDNEKLENQVTGLLQEKQRLKDFADQVENKYHTLRSEIDKLAFEISGKEKIIDSKTSQIEALNDVISQHLEDLSSSEADLETQRAATGKLQAHIESQDEFIKMLAGKKDKLQVDIEVYREINNNTKEMVSMNRKINASKLEIRDREIKRLKAENTEFCEQLKQCHEIMTHKE